MEHDAECVGSYFQAVFAANAVIHNFPDLPTVRWCRIWSARETHSRLARLPPSLAAAGGKGSSMTRHAGIGLTNMTTPRLRAEKSSNAFTALDICGRAAYHLLILTLECRKGITT